MFLILSTYTLWLSAWELLHNCNIELPRLGRGRPVLTRSPKMPTVKIWQISTQALGDRSNKKIGLYLSVEEKKKDGYLKGGWAWKN